MSRREQTDRDVRMLQAHGVEALFMVRALRYVRAGYSYKMAADRSRF